MPEKITREELERRLADPDVPIADLEAYVRVELRPDKPFSPTIVANPMLVDEGVVAESGLFLDYFNEKWAARRQRRYRRKIEAGWSGHKLVAEGDSWFQYPLGERDDLIDYLMPANAIFCMSAGGDTLANMASGVGDIEQRIDLEEATGLLLSAGGNDLAGRDETDPQGRAGLARFLRGDHPNHPNPSPDFYISIRFARFLDDSMTKYQAIVDRMLARFPDLKIFVHGYDRPFPVPSGTWLGPALAEFQIAESHWHPIVAIMIDRFNDRLRDLAGTYPGSVHYVDCRGAVGDASQWRDEMHGRSAACKRAAVRLQEAINRVFPLVV